MKRASHILWGAAAGVLCVGVGAARADTVADLGPALSSLASQLAPPGTASGEMAGRLIQMIGLMTVISLAPGLLIVMTCFTRFVIVLSMLRSALGLNQSPPNMVLTSLALFMTFFVMQPVFKDAWEQGLAPLLQSSISEEQALPRIAAPFHRFMEVNTRAAEIGLFERIAARRIDKTPDTAEKVQLRDGVDPAASAPAGTRADIPWSTLVPAFMLSELRRAFTIGFLIFLPFVAIDLIVSSILMGAGMMMLSPTMISLPIKVIFFVVIDGWYMLAGSLMQSYVGI